MSDRSIRLLGVTTLGTGVLFAGLCLVLMIATDSPQMGWVAAFAAAAGALGNLVGRKH